MGNKIKGKLLFIGLEGAGKTTMISVCKNSFVPNEDEIKSIKPTLSEGITRYNKEGVEFTAWDLSGKEQYQSLWKHYYTEVTMDAVVWVVDCSSPIEGIEQSRDLLFHTLQEIALKDAILLICANKQDVPNCNSLSKVQEVLELHRLQKRVWKIQGTCATTGEGLNEGFTWLSSEIKNKKAKAAKP